MLIPPVPDCSHVWTAAGGFNCFFSHVKKKKKKRSLQACSKQDCVNGSSNSEDNMAVCVRPLGQNQKGRENWSLCSAGSRQHVSRLEASWGGGIKKGIQPWHTCSDTSGFQRGKNQPCGLRNAPSLGCIEGNAEAAGEMIWSVAWGGNGANGGRVRGQIALMLKEHRWAALWSSL